MKYNITDNIIEKYKDLKNPDYSFKKFRNPIYSKIIEELNLLDFKTKNDTDLNYMVCEYYYLVKKGEIYSLLLSLIGPYSLIIKKIN